MSVTNFVYSGIASLTIGITGCLAEDVCVNNQNQFYCRTGCCGSYGEHHCCSQTGLIVGIVVCVAVIISIVVIYCYIKHRNRKRAQGNFLRPVPHGQPIGCLNNIRRGPPTVAGPTMPAYPPPYDFTITQPPLQPKGPPPAYDSVYRTSAGIGVGASSNPGYPAPVS